MRVLVSAVPALGHVVPLLDLAGALERAGHEVRFATNAQRHALLVDAGLQPVSAGMSTVDMVAAAAASAARQIAELPSAADVVPLVESLARHRPQ